MENTTFKFPAKLKTVSLVLLGIGAVALLIGMFTLLNGEQMDQNRFWATLIQDSIFFLLICVASLFILAATSLAQAGWIVAFRRIPEAIGSIVWILGIIVFIVLGIQILTDNVHVYKWLQDGHIPDNSLNGLKNFFLSKPFFLIWTALVIFLWGWFGKKFGDISSAMDDNAGDKRTTSKLLWKNYNYSAGFILVFALSLASTIPWLWLMSLDAHWFSTMYSWYTFASTFVSGMAMIMLWILYSKRNGNLELVSNEHVHDVGKFMFAFSIFWTYLWFSQFMLIWYANIPEETVYYKIRAQGPYKFFFYFNIVINFITPILILMSRPAKRNYFVVSLVAILLLFGHWIDFYQMVMPAIVNTEWTIGWYEIGILCGFVGLVTFLVGNKLTKTKQVPVGHPYVKETIIHVS